MSYFLGKILPIAFADAIIRTMDALKNEGFGVLTDIDVSATLKEKIGVEFPSYRILGACNPALAYEALKLESKVGTMLPCNVVVRDAGGGQTEVAAIDPVASMQAIDNPELKRAAEQVRVKLEKVIAALGSANTPAFVTHQHKPPAGRSRHARPRFTTTALGRLFIGQSLGRLVSRADRNMGHWPHSPFYLIGLFGGWRVGCRGGCVSAAICLTFRFRPRASSRVAIRSIAARDWGGPNPAATV